MPVVESCASGSKRYGTLQLCLSCSGEDHPPLALIFRGKGHVFEKEKDGYHPLVRVHYNEAAWATRLFCEEWATKDFIPHIKSLQPGWLETEQQDQVLLYMDSLDAQRRRGFITLLSDAKVHCAFGPRGLTHGWQPIDVGHIGRLLKDIYNNMIHD